MMRETEGKVGVVRGLKLEREGGAVCVEEQSLPQIRHAAIQKCLRSCTR